MSMKEVKRKARKKEETNPMFRSPGAWLWLLCAPAAIFISANHEANKSIEKKRAKKAKKDAEFWLKYPEWWFYSD